MSSEGKTAPPLLVVTCDTAIPIHLAEPEATTIFLVAEHLSDGWVRHLVHETRF